MAIVHVNEDNFEEVVLRSDKLVLINFFSPLSDKCAEFLKTLEVFSDKHKNIIQVIRIDVNESPSLTEAFEVKHIPAIVSMQGDQPLVGMVGVLTTDMLQAMLDRSLQILGKHHINNNKLPGSKPPKP